MSTTFPGVLDALVNPQGADYLNTVQVLHSVQHANANDAIEAIQAKIGIDSSSVVTSLNYLLRDSASVNPGHQHTLTSLPNMVDMTTEQGFNVSPQHVPPPDGISGRKTFTNQVRITVPLTTKNVSPSSGLRINAYMGAEATYSSAYHTRALDVGALINIASGVTDIGKKTGAYIDVLRNEISGAAGSQSGEHKTEVIQGCYIVAGHYDIMGGETPISGTIYGARVDMFGKTGTITNLYGLHIGFTSGGTVTNNWGIYQASNLQKNYLAGQVNLNGATGYQQLRLQGTYTPTGAADANGDIGIIAWDTGYIYVKTAAGAWKRAALSTF